MSPATDKLGMLVRVRGRERDRCEQALLAQRREHDRCRAELRRRQDMLIASQARHLAALNARMQAPGDMLVADYLQCEQTALHTLSKEERQASDELDRSGDDLTRARIEHHRAQLRLEVLQNELANAHRQEQRRITRKQESALPALTPGSAVPV